MVEVESHLDQACGVKNLDRAIQWVNPPPSKAHLRHIVSSFKSLARYVASEGDLPPGFSLFRRDNIDSRLRERFIGSTHVSKRAWGWVGKHGYTVFIKLEDDPQNPITAVAVLHTEAPIQEEIYIAGKRLTALGSKYFRIRKKLGEGQVPKFRI